MSSSATPAPLVTSDPALRAMLRSLELTINRKLDGILHGHYQGITPGHGSEPGESRVYQPGDDVRRIDWNVTTRTQQLHVRDLIADRDLEAWIVIDASPSMAFGTARAEKRQVALTAAAAVGFLTARHHNKVGAVIGAGSWRRSLPPRQGTDQVRAILTAIATAPVVEGGGRTDLAALCSDAGGRARRTGFVTVISDFLAPGGRTGWPTTLGPVGIRHDLLAIEVVDPRELDLPDVGLVEFVDPATGNLREVKLTADVRRRYADAAAAQRAQIHSELLGCGAHHLQLRTDRDWITDIVRFVDRRRRHGWRAAASKAGARAAR